MQTFRLNTVWGEMSLDIQLLLMCENVQSKNSKRQIQKDLADFCHCMHYECI